MQTPKMTSLSGFGRRMAWRYFAVFFLGAWLWTLPRAGVSAGSPAGRPDPFLEARGKIVGLIEETKVPSVSVAVVKDGAIVWEEAFGLANIEKGVQATPRTLYPIASATKPFTATGVMILVERGLVGLEKSANVYLGRTKLRAFEGDVSAATVRRILQHTSGIPMYWSFDYGPASRRRPPLETTLERYGRLVNKPGESYNYSNLGYAVLESVIEEVGGKPYPEFMAAEIFAPLKLERTIVATAPPQGDDFAVKYSASLAPVPFCDHDTRGAGAIYATAHDLARFCLLHLGRLQPDQKPILKPASVVAMQRTQDPDVRWSSYALGWETGRRCGYSIVTHGGVIDGCRAHLAMIPSEGLAVAVLINGENARTIQICDWIFASRLPVYARNLGAASPGGGASPPAPPFNPPAEFIGVWEGLIRTHDGDVPVRLNVERDGRVELFGPNQPAGSNKGLAPLKPPVVNQGVFVVHFPRAFSLSDAPSPGHRTVLGLTSRGNRLSGEVNLIASDMSYSLPSYIELKRIR